MYVIVVEIREKMTFKQKKSSFMYDSAILFVSLSHLF